MPSLSLLVLLICPIAMVLMMLFMGKGMFASRKDRSAREGSLAELTLERACLDAEIERLERRAGDAERIPSASA